MSRVDSNWSGQPGPRPMHCCTRPLQVECTASQGSPVSRQKAPRVLGEVSPTFAWQKAATRLGDTPPKLRAASALLLPLPFLPLPLLLLPDAWSGCACRPAPALAQCSVNCAAAPLLSPLTSVLVLFMLVPCTGNQLKAPMALQGGAGARQSQGRALDEAQQAAGMALNAVPFPAQLQQQHPHPDSSALLL